MVHGNGAVLISSRLPNTISKHGRQHHSAIHLISSPVPHVPGQAPVVDRWAQICTPAQDHGPGGLQLVRVGMPLLQVTGPALKAALVICVADGLSTVAAQQTPPKSFAGATTAA